MTNLGSKTAVLSEDGQPEIPVTVLSTAELAECNCPEFCERDHDAD
jgi:hypothetical protein